jgi:hypothetical protein
MNEKQILPPRKIVPMPVPQKARIKAFRVPTDFALQQILGYQGSSTFFKVMGYAGTEIPEDWKIWNVGVWCEYIRGEGIFCVIEHPSFPEHELGKSPIPIIDFIIGEMEVERMTPKKDKLDFESWRKENGLITFPETTALRALYEEYLTS